MDVDHIHELNRSELYFERELMPTSETDKVSRFLGTFALVLVPQQCVCLQAKTLIVAHLYKCSLLLSAVVFLDCIFFSGGGGV